ncbi:dephospho-CoA kinase [Oceanobacillus sp. 143]|uniref:Dephospho-CoA kinase n=1 Tax=Oceanobacillus zhaokaii TaxID=2052660 RepID=A0A345PI30_9BACI|nr:dephospho-CoA kinase [Oceanobacillus zhaokaii]AXI09660.1 dephospho-CoA kinase [Oceanobacillus zhaokaii]QGS69002.1 dephospho-CoA kinase [Oceanobacillus sp. 143]
MALVIGLTGSIASGKSTVSLMFDDFQIPVIDADKIAREVVEPGEAAYEGIVAAFGEAILIEDKTLDRKKLGSIIFADEDKRQTLNSIVHPEVRKQMIEQRDALIAAGKRCIVLDIPLLFESNLTSLVDKTIVVYVDESIQLQRLMERDGLAEQAAKQRIASQIPVEEKVKLANAVINNNGSKKESYEQLEQILSDWQVR